MELSPKLDRESVEVDGKKVSYWVRGPVEAQYAYVGINGLMGGGDSFWPVIEGVPTHWRVVLPDLPGCGGSEGMETAGNHSVEGYAGWVGKFVTAVGLRDKKVVLASVATGAPISIRYALEQREQVVGQVLHLPFLGKVAISARWARPVVAYGLKARPLRKFIDTLRSSNAVMHRIILSKPPDAIPELAERDIAHKQEADLQAAGELLHDLMLQDARIELKEIGQPLLILASEHDFSAPLPVLEGIVQGRPERRLYVYRGGQHSWNEEFIEEMNKEIGRFLSRVESGEGESVAEATGGQGGSSSGGW